VLRTLRALSRARAIAEMIELGSLTSATRNSATHAATPTHDRRGTVRQVQRLEQQVPGRRGVGRATLEQAVVSHIEHARGVLARSR
jgi:hypothetical protein